MPDVFLALVEESIPRLRRYANSLCHNVDAADDLVQDTLVRSLAARRQFAEGTNFMAWASTILRNRFIEQRRRSRDAAEPVEEVIDRYRVTLPSQEAVVEFSELARAFWRLSPDHREILMMVGVNGLSYEQAAEKLGRAKGTVRSRLSRAREELRSALDRQPKARRARSPEGDAMDAPEIHAIRSQAARRAWQPVLERAPLHAD